MMDILFGSTVGLLSVFTIVFSTGMVIYLLIKFLRLAKTTNRSDNMEQS